MKISKESIKPLIQGQNLIDLGVSPGPEMGRILKALYQKQLDNEFDSMETGIAAAKKLIDEGLK